MIMTISEHDDIVVFHLEGNLGLDAIRLLKDHLQQKRKDGILKIVLDFKEVSNVQSSVLKELLTPVRAMLFVQGIVGLCNMSKSIHRTLQTGLFYKGVLVYDTLDDALKAFREY